MAPAVSAHSIKLVAFIIIIDAVFRISISRCLQEDTTRKVEKGTTSTTESLPMVYVITPTYARAAQMADLTRLSQALQGVPNVTWILVEDSRRKTQKVERLLNKTNIKSGDYYQLLYTSAHPDTIQSNPTYSLQGMDEKDIVSLSITQHDSMTHSVKMKWNLMKFSSCPT